MADIRVEPARVERMRQAAAGVTPIAQLPTSVMCSGTQHRDILLLLLVKTEPDRQRILLRDGFNALLADSANELDEGESPF